MNTLNKQLKFYKLTFIALITLCCLLSKTSLAIEYKVEVVNNLGFDIHAHANAYPVDVGSQNNINNPYQIGRNFVALTVTYSAAACLNPADDGTLQFVDYEYCKQITDRQYPNARAVACLAKTSSIWKEGYTKGIITVAQDTKNQDCVDGGNICLTCTFEWVK